jgi:transcriptional regulator with XRE-family HTH domain
MPNAEGLVGSVWVRAAKHATHSTLTSPSLWALCVLSCLPQDWGGEGEAQTMGEDLTFGALLRRFRLTASLSQAVLAERAHVSTNAIAALERGRRGAPRPATVQLLADALCLGPAQRTVLIAAAAAPRARAASPVASALPPLPIPLTSFVGREHELASVQLMLAATRVLTLTGVGGIGNPHGGFTILR